MSTALMVYIAIVCCLIMDNTTDTFFNIHLRLLNDQQEVDMNTSEHSSKVAMLYYDCFLEHSPQAAKIVTNTQLIQNHCR